ncbi:MAG: SDR family NAD(P)-dependent oxidoreductase [Pseudomonadota bacterium]|nr:SDR family NAD(P)-dependent oxidoreductase [Pseudomonadota bacterium]
MGSFDTNIKGVLYCTRAILPGMVERERRHIVNIYSTAATNNYKSGNVGGCSKAFVRQFSINHRCDLLGTPIPVSSIEPGMMETRFTEVRFREDSSKTGVHHMGLTPLSGDDLADVTYYTTMVPAHVNVNSLQVTPIGMAPAGYAIHRE